MDAVREQLNRPLVAGITGAVLGLILGLLIGYVFWPIEYTDAAPEHLRVEWQEEYLRMAIHTYNRTGNAAAAVQRWEELGETAPELLQQIQANPGTLAPNDITNFQNVVAAGAPPVVEEPEPGVTPEATAVAESRSIARTVLPIMCLLTVILAGALVAVFLLRGRVRTTGAGPTAAMQAQEAARDAEWTNYTESGEEPPMAQFMASYKVGDDLFDDSFSVDSPSGEFLGECGVGISETIGVGDPKKVTAFEVWLFDKNDIQTVTKVLMSAHAFADDSIRQRLAAKGEPVQANPGSQVVLETATLQLVARVVDMAYGEGALPEESFFDSIILELAVWQK